MTGGVSERGALIFLVGYRGTGKSTVGRLLAARLGWAFADADDHVEAAAGKSIKEIFAAEGETAFRDLESQALAVLCERSGCVIATGGGAILREANRALLTANGYVAWLTAAPETVVARLETDSATWTRRPNLTATGGEAEVRSLIAVREPLYRAVADFVVATDSVSPEVVAGAIFTAWTASGRTENPS